MKSLLTSLSYCVAMIMNFLVGSAVAYRVIEKYGEIEIQMSLIGIVVAWMCFQAACKILFMGWK